MSDPHYESFVKQLNRGARRLRAEWVYQHLDLIEKEPLSEIARALRGAGVYAPNTALCDIERVLPSYIRYAKEKKANETKRIIKVCGECGSENVFHDAVFLWDLMSQRWVLGELFNYAFCKDCDDECSIEDKPNDKGV